MPMATGSSLFGDARCLVWVTAASRQPTLRGNSTFWRLGRLQSSSRSVDAGIRASSRLESPSQETNGPVTQTQARIHFKPQGPFIMAIIIRPEQPGDEQFIHDLTVAAFKSKSYSDGSEAPIITSLRKDGDLTLSLVAVEGSAIVGHIAFSPVMIGTDEEGWYGLGPVSVWPHHQRRGIGSALIDDGLKILKARGAKGCALVGDPGYYRRFGFQSDGCLSYQGLPAEHVQSLSFGEEAASGPLRFSPAFER